METRQSFYVAVLGQNSAFSHIAYLMGNFMSQLIKLQNELFGQIAWTLSVHLPVFPSLFFSFSVSLSPSYLFFLLFSFHFHDQGHDFLPHCRSLTLPFLLASFPPTPTTLRSLHPAKNTPMTLCSRCDGPCCSVFSFQELPLLCPGAQHCDNSGYLGMVSCCGGVSPA